MVATPHDPNGGRPLLLLLALLHYPTKDWDSESPVQLARAQEAGRISVGLATVWQEPLLRSKAGC